MRAYVRRVVESQVLLPPADKAVAKKSVESQVLLPLFFLHRVSGNHCLAQIFLPSKVHIVALLIAGAVSSTTCTCVSVEKSSNPPTLTVAIRLL